jgi:hypothetical protein
MIRIGFTGAHRVGKTFCATFCEEYLKKTYPDKSVNFLKSSATQIAKDYNFNINSKSSLNERITFQEKLLENAAVEYSYADCDYLICDRTPIDLVAYTLAEATSSMSNGTNEDQKLVKYMKNGLQLTKKSFDFIIYVPTGLEYKDEEGKPNPLISYQNHIDLIIQGMIGTNRDYYSKVEYLTCSIEERQKTLEVMLESFIDRGKQN